MINAGYVSKYKEHFNAPKISKCTEHPKILLATFPRIIKRNYACISSKINDEDIFKIILGFSSLIVFNYHPKTDFLNRQALDFKSEIESAMCNYPSSLDDLSAWIGELYSRKIVIT